MSGTFGGAGKVGLTGRGIPRNMEDSIASGKMKQRWMYPGYNKGSLAREDEMQVDLIFWPAAGYQTKVIERFCGQWTDSSREQNAKPKKVLREKQRWC